MKVGESLLSGMKTLGGMALSAAKNHIISSTPPGRQQTASSPQRKYVSTSAPSGVNLGDPSGARRERRYSNTSQDSVGWSYSGGSEQAYASPVMPNTPIGPEQGSYVTILDLGPLLGNAGCAPVTISEFFTSRSQPVAGLYFSSDGCSVVVVPANGQVPQVYQVRPAPLRYIGGSGDWSGGGTDQAKRAKDTGAGAEVVTRLYRLNRGRSQAIIDDAAWTNDGRWAAIGTLRPTIHVFALNPYGGKPDVKSHIKGKVLNVNELVSRSSLVG